MASWTKESVIEEMLRLMRLSRNLGSESPHSAAHTSWLLQATRFLEEVFGPGSIYFKTFANIQWTHRGSMMVLVEEALTPGSTEDRYNAPVFLKGLDRANGIFEAAAEELERVGIKGVYTSAGGGRETSDVLRILNLAEVKLRKILRKKPENEKEVQDAFENLLVGAEIAYSRESEAIEYSSKTYYPDFTMPQADLAVEIKFCNHERHEKEFIAQINDDIVAYRTKYGNLVFIVYDCGFIRDMDRFVDSFEAQGAVTVRVVKH